MAASRDPPRSRRRLKSCNVRAHDRSRKPCRNATAFFIRVSFFGSGHGGRGSIARRAHEQPGDHGRGSCPGQPRDLARVARAARLQADLGGKRAGLYVAGLSRRFRWCGRFANWRVGGAGRNQTGSKESTKNCKRVRRNTVIVDDTSA